MSAFLSKIHYWLYNKIQIHESLIKEISEFSIKNGYDTHSLIETSYKKFGLPVIGNLEEEIEHSNIHAWLQERIVSVEQRLAYIITELLKIDVLSKEDIAEIFKNNAEHIMKQIDIQNESPQYFFMLIFDYMLEGMPCDRVNKVINNDNKEISWETTRCLHKNYWDNVGGEIDNFYYFRDSWINGFLNASGMNYIYNRADDGINAIRKG